MKFVHAHRFAAMIFSALLVLILAGCSGTTPAPATLQSIAVTPANPSISTSATQQFTATGTYSNSTTKDITSQVTWASATTTVATISAAGLATSVGAGTSNITATLGSVVGQTVLTVTAPVTLKSIAVTPANPSISLNVTQQFTATGTYSDNSTKNITSQVTWASATTTVATISAAGLATPVGGGTSNITATLGTVSGSTVLTVTVPTLTSIAVTPANPSITKGATQQFTATGTYSDTTTKNITSQVTWASQTTTVATISAAGLATSVGQGTSTITATLGAVSGQTVLTVNPPTLQSIRMAPLTPTIAVGGTVDFTAVGVYSDGSTQPLASLAWSSGTTTTASINASSGISIGLAAGTSTITATSGTFTASTLLTVSAATSRFAYVGNQLDGSISIYAVNPANGTFSPRGYVADNSPTTSTGYPGQVIPEPSGRFAYALNGYSAPGSHGTIGIYSINSVTGALTLIGTPVDNGSFHPLQGVIDPTGQFLYTANTGDNVITAYKIDTVAGGLTSISLTINTPNSPYSVIVDHTGKFLYVINDGSSKIDAYSINSSSGALTAISAAPAPPYNTGLNPTYAAIDPQNKFLFVADVGDNTVAVFSINSTNGTLTPVGAGTFSTGAGSTPIAVAVDPSSSYLYVVNFGTDSVSVYSLSSLNSSGTLPTTALFTYSTSPTGAFIGAGPSYINMDPAGAYVAVVNLNSNTLALFKRNSADGSLTSTGNIETRESPTLSNIYVAPASPAIEPAAVFAPNSTAGTVSAYTVTPATGALVPTTAPVNGVAGNIFATTDVTGQFFYTTSGTAKDLDGFSVTQATAALAGLPASPYSLGTAVPSSVVADPSDRFVYTAATGASGSVLGFNLDPVNGLMPFAGGGTAVSNLNAIVPDPQGLALFGLSTNSIQPLPIYAVNGTITTPLPAALSATGSWTSGVVDASGQYLLALDSVGKQIQVFSIGPLAASFAAVGAPVSTGGTLPSTLVIDPLNRFVFVTDATANTITTFSFNPLTGGVAMVGSPVTVTGSAGQAAVDATGTYLYVAVQGNPVTNAGSVAVFKINSTGTTLTPVTGSPFAAGVGTQGVAVSNSIQ